MQLAHGLWPLHFDLRFRHGSQAAHILFLLLSRLELPASSETDTPSDTASIAVYAQCDWTYDGRASEVQAGV